MNTKATTQTEAKACACGTCHEAVSARALYRPGHDARHVSVLVQGLVNDIADGRKVTKQMIASTAEELPSEPLRAKFTRAADRMVAKATEPKPEPKAEVAQ
ncbi:hypothetical protein [Microbacterium dextranolyticum]|uniref:Uncharacterized protein n=1 Tax=Microbacterium dextranolyticum TaxID=36806 RepID=A0A9W6HM22_9MICO|nr:hypothetical protein [Microbacterium dextranolyticum]MBM7463218.1 hypothetical protein [Microbacterium dextranolyticum]GLJ95677.1 hypothetical protein GCM10017591_17400 [Microbacterium dextranolyticum]